MKLGDLIFRCPLAMRSDDHDVAERALFLICPTVMNLHEEHYSRQSWDSTLPAVVSCSGLALLEKGEALTISTLLESVSGQGNTQSGDRSTANLR